MRIAEFISIETTNGAARHGLAVAEAMAARGHDVTLFHRHWLGPEAAAARGVNHEEIEFSLEGRELAALGRRLARLGVEVIHTHTSKALAVALALRMAGGPPVVATAHSLNLQLSWAFADLVIAPTAAAAAYHRRVNRVAGRRIRVIPSLIGAQWFSPATPARRTAARARLGASENAVVVGAVADVHPDKRLPDLIRAADMADALNLVVALKGAAIHLGEARRLEAISAGARTRVIHVLDRADVGGFLDALDIAAVVSAREVGPFAAFEAMSAGLPLVATDVGRIGEIAGDAAAVVVPRGDLGALAAAIRRLADDGLLRRRLGAAGKVRIARLRDDARAFGEIEATLLEAAALRRRTAPQLLGAGVIGPWLNLFERDRSAAQRA